MQIIIVAAKSDNRIIGKENDLPWHLPADLHFFLQTIQGAYLLTGRKSYESAQGNDIFKENSPFVIITRNRNYQSSKGEIAHSVEEGIAIAEADGATRLCILGGGHIYEQAMKLADKMILTEVHTFIKGDTYFPEIDLTYWKEVSRIRFTKNKENIFDYSFVEYVKK